ncbi:MAG: hypothetical protein ACLFV2_09935 [Desulfurivibrionaceae bacterium]
MDEHKIVPADRLKEIKPSPTLAVNAKANAMKAEGTDILNFSVGEPDFATPDHVCEAGKKPLMRSSPAIPQCRVLLNSERL